MEARLLRGAAGAVIGAAVGTAFALRAEIYPVTGVAVALAVVGFALGFFFHITRHG